VAQANARFDQAYKEDRARELRLAQFRRELPADISQNSGLDCAITAQNFGYKEKGAFVISARREIAKVVEVESLS
jgi:hypothetical protein